MQDSKRTNANRRPYKGKKPFSTAGPSQQIARPQPPPRVATPPLAESVPLDTPRFADLAKENLLHPVMLHTITEDLKFDHMMPVQAATLHDLLKNRIDCLAQAKTGTGKTMAFLLPAIQTLINKRRGGDSGVSLLVLTPTRELAMQIAKEATALLQRLPQYKISFAIGGTNKDKEEKQILQGHCNILVATPGRLLDHLSSEEVRYAFRDLDTLVLDEADRLLDMGFMDSLKKIVHCLPNKERSGRQGMLFSATIAPHVQKVAHLVLSKNYKFISTIPEGEINTHERVPQHLVVVPEFSDMATALVGVLRSEIAIEDSKTFKAIVFAPTAALVDFYGEVLSNIPNMPNISVLHSRVSQSKRTSVTNAYREAKNGILVATDVVARGMDFPDVTNVIQVGIPQEKESYIHRLGRTARAGKEGRGAFIITKHETWFSKYQLREIDFHEDPADLSEKEAVIAACGKLSNPSKVYSAWLGFYKTFAKSCGWDNAALVQQANKFAHDGLCLPEIPGITKRTIGKMGLKGTPGLVIAPDEPHASHARGGGEGRLAGRGAVAKPSTSGPSKDRGPRPVKAQSNDDGAGFGTFGSSARPPRKNRGKGKGGLANVEGAW
ncbi:P-loop containing nucleoside triphosphate hydrolase protein [Halenospora varia]|nr:P-loop containing nucleoside triphosphate hydrolase protein [Halenospora varia]